MKLDNSELEKVQDEAELLVAPEQVEAALDQMAQAITDELAHANPLVLCVMMGGLVPAGHLLTRLNFPLQVDYIHVTRYYGGTKGKELAWIKTPAEPVTDRAVLIIDDIFDEGLTLEAVVQCCENSGAARVLTAVLVEKDKERDCSIKHADFTGLTIEDRYVYGYGMDYMNYLRNANGIYAVKDL